MLRLSFQDGFVVLATWLLWRVVRRYIVKSPYENLPGPARKSFIFGNLGQITDRHGWAFVQELAEKYGSVVKVHGLFGSKFLCVFDPVALRTIAMREPYNFQFMSWNLRMNRIVFAQGLLSTAGEHHKKQRKLLNPAFSTANMKSILPTFYEVTDKLRQAITKLVQDGETEVDMMSWMGRASLELIGQGGLGYSFDPLVGETDDPFSTTIKALVPNLSAAGLIMRMLLPMIPSEALRNRVVRALPLKRTKRLLRTVDMSMAHATEIFERRKRALEKGDGALVNQVGEGKDLMSILMRANMIADENEKLSDHELISQISTLVVAAVDTTSAALAITLNQLAYHPEVQARLREEILEARHGGARELAYEELDELPFLDAVCRETLRLYPSAPLRFREAVSDTVLPLSKPIVGTDGQMITEIAVPAGTDLVVHIPAINTSPELWGEDAGEWKPDRWLKPLPQSVGDANIPGVYSNLMTFFGGARACIGFRFSQLEMKTVLVALISNFTFAPSGVPITWNLAIVRYPTVGTDSNDPHLPMKVGLVKRSCST